MMDWQTLQDVLREWGCSASGLPTFWFGEDVENQDKPYLELQVGSSEGLGVDETRQTFDDSQPPGQEIVRTEVGNRLFTLSIRAKTRDQTPTGAARNYLEKVRTALHKKTTLDLFKSKNIAVVRAMGIVNMDAVFQDRQQSVALMDVRLATLAIEADPHDKGGYIESIKVTSTLKDAGGTELPASVQINDKEMPE